MGVHNSLVEGENGLIYIGSGLNELTEVALSAKMPYGRRAIENQLWLDIKSKYEGYTGGKIYKYDPEEGDTEVYLPEDEAVVREMTTPVSGNSIYAMVYDSTTSSIYGISYPDAGFFQYNVEKKALTNHGNWLKTMSYAGPERSWRSVPRSLVVAGDGKVYSSGDGGMIQYYDPFDKTIKVTQMRIPGEYWITQKYEGYPVVEQLLVAGAEKLVGSSSDGFVFTVDLASQELYSHGKPMVERRIRAMTIGNDNQLYLICGEKVNVCRMFSFDLMSPHKGFLDYGVLGVDRSPYYARIGYQFDAMCTAADGTIFIGESDRRAKLFFYIPGGRVFPGVLNPTNPR
jgi:hypothetical protein